MPLNKETNLTKAWIAIDRLSIIWKSDLTDKMKRSFFQAAVVSILLYGCTTWTLTKRLKKKLDGNYTRMLRVILNNWRQHPTRHQLYGHLPPITKTIQVRRTRHAGHCWRSKDELISNVLLWTLAYGQAKAGRPARTYIQQLCEDTGCNPEDLPKAMNDREKWRERESQGYPCWQHDMMMMMMIVNGIFYFIFRWTIVVHYKQYFYEYLLRFDMILFIMTHSSCWLYDSKKQNILRAYLLLFPIRFVPRFRGNTKRLKKT